MREDRRGRRPTLAGRPVTEGTIRGISRNRGNDDEDDADANVRRFQMRENRDRFAIDLDPGADLKVQGNVVDHEYQIERDGARVAQISKRWFRVRHTYGVEVEQGEDVGLVLAITAALESMTKSGQLVARPGRPPRDDCGSGPAR